MRALRDARHPRSQLNDSSGVVVYSDAQRLGQGPYPATISGTFVHGENICKLAFHQQAPSS